MKTLLYKWVFILLTLAPLASCKEARKSIEETLHPKPQKKIATPAPEHSSTVTFSIPDQEDYKSIFESATALDSIQQELCSLPHLKGKKLFFFLGFFFYDYQGGMISINLQDPDHPENIDTYVYSNGEWQEQQPFKVPGRLPLKNMLMSLDEVKFSTAKKVYDAGVEKSKTIEGAEAITHVYFDQIKAVRVKEWYLMIKGARRDYQVKFDVNGKFVGMK